MVYIVFDKDIKNILIRHALTNPTKELGGFLYGNIEEERQNVTCKVDAIYYENKVGTGSEFNFNLSYISNAKQYLLSLKNSLLLGTYHSHGQYPAIFSDIDRTKLQRYFGQRKITVIYSPMESKLIGEYLDERNISNKCKILTK